MKQFYIYVHCKPNGDPFYVGKGRDCRHNKRSHKFRDRNKHHKNIVAKYGKENIEILIFPRESEQDAFNDEIKWIKTLRAEGHDLVNMTNGGEGTSGCIPPNKGISPSEETRRKMSLSAMGRKPTDEARQKMSIAKKGQKGSMLGKKLTDEQRLKLSLALKGRKAWNKGISMSSAGRRHSPETLLKLSVAMKNKPWTEARRNACNKKRDE